MSITPVKGIVFDLDGTLVDSLSVTFDAFNHGIEAMGGRRLSPEEIMSYFGPGEGEIFAQIVGPQKAESAYEACREYLSSHIDSVPLHDGVGDLLEALKRDGVPLSIFTGRSWNTTEVILKHHGLMDRFITVIANDHVDFPKPSPAGLFLALSRMKLEPAQVLFVGDSPVDIRAAHSARSNGVAALWDWMAERAHLEPHAPHHWAEKPADILELFKKLS